MYQKFFTKRKLKAATITAKTDLLPSFGTELRQKFKFYKFCPYTEIKIKGYKNNQNVPKIFSKEKIQSCYYDF